MTFDPNSTPPGAAEEPTTLPPHQQQQHQEQCDGTADAPPLTASHSTEPRSCESAINSPEAVLPPPAESATTSLLTPLVAEHLALATPLASTVSSDGQHEQDSAAVTKTGDNDDEDGDTETVAQADEEPGCEAETARRTNTLKRNRRALFAASDGNAELSSSCASPNEHREGEPESVSSSDEHRPSDDQKTDSTESSLERKQVALSDMEFLHTSGRQAQRSVVTPVTTRNAFDDPEDDATLLIRKKWKRSLHQTVILSGESHQLQQSDTESFVLLSQPTRLSFTRSMSSQSVFIDKPASTSSVPIGVSQASSSSAVQAREATIHQLVLPTVRSASHPDLNVISPQTVSRLLDGEFKTQLASYALIDCRFSYEHEGGCLRGAQALCDPASVEQAFLWNPSKDCKRTALVFYCEFSANRAPKMLRHIRNLDRWIHAEKYPELFYPELYLVDGGYKNCFETFKLDSVDTFPSLFTCQDEICEPQSYTPMNHADCVENCKREFALWRKRWKAHKTSACAAKFQIRHQRPDTSSSQISDSSIIGDTTHETEEEEENFCLELPALHPPVTLRSFSEML